MLVLKSEEKILISDLLNKEKISFHMPCGGRGVCQKCRVKVWGNILPPTNYERSLLTEEDLKNSVRFSCLAYVQGEIWVEFINEKSFDNSDKILTDVIVKNLVPDKDKQDGYGVAIDLGTTTVALYLYKLRIGECIDVLSCINSQTSFGADVITRIDKAVSGKSRELAESIVSCLNSNLKLVADKNKIGIDEICEIVIAGNTAMMYLLCGKSPESIARAPFIQDEYFGEFIKPSDIGVGLSGECRLYLVRSISSYVGGDITAAVMAASLQNDKVKLLADIGTNGEMVLYVPEKPLICCSTAAGPTFEGVGIECGMTARTGAIYKADICDEAICSYVISDGADGAITKAEGICGSGIIDVVAAMLELELIDETGRFCNEDDFYTLPGTDISITQKDIREVQLAKAAICAGIYTLINKAGLQVTDISELMVAGGFGNNINMKSAERIGLVPKNFSNKTRFIGNAAGQGAAMILLNRETMELSERISCEAETVQLSTDEFFMDKYIECMMFER